MAAVDKPAYATSERKRKAGSTWYRKRSSMGLLPQHGPHLPGHHHDEVVAEPVLPTDLPDVSRSGFLHKKVHNKHWKLRYVVLQNAEILDYAVDPQKRQPVLSSPVFRTRLADTSLLVNPAKFKFIVEGKHKAYTAFKTESAETMEQWIRSVYEVNGSNTQVPTFYRATTKDKIHKNLTKIFKHSKSAPETPEKRHHNDAVDDACLEVPERLALALHVTAARENLVRLPAELESNPEAVLPTLNLVVERVAQIMDTVTMCESLAPAGAAEPMAPINCQSCYLTLHNELAKVVHLVDSSFSRRHDFRSPGEVAILRFKGSCRLAADTLKRLQRLVLHEEAEPSPPGPDLPRTDSAGSAASDGSAVAVFLSDDYELGVNHLVEMGFTREQAAPAIVDVGGDVVAALSLLLSVSQGDDAAPASPSTIRKRFSLLGRAKAKPQPPPKLQRRTISRKRTLSPPRRSGSMRLRDPGFGEAAHPSPLPATQIVGAAGARRASATPTTGTDSGGPAAAAAAAASPTSPACTGGAKAALRRRSRSLSGADRTPELLTLPMPAAVTATQQQGGPQQPPHQSLASRGRVYSTLLPREESALRNAALWPKARPKTTVFDPSAIQAGAEQLMNMGFDRVRSESSLRMNSMDIAAALDDLLAWKTATEVDHERLRALMDDDEDEDEDASLDAPHPAATATAAAAAGGEEEGAEQPGPGGAGAPRPLTFVPSRTSPARAASGTTSPGNPFAPAAASDDSGLPSDQSAQPSDSEDEELHVVLPPPARGLEGKVGAVAAMGFDEAAAREALVKHNESVALAVEELLLTAPPTPPTGRSRSNSLPLGQEEEMRLTDASMEQQRARAFTVAAKFAPTNPFSPGRPPTPGNGTAGGAPAGPAGGDLSAHVPAGPATPTTPATLLMEEDLLFKHEVVCGEEVQRLRAGTLPAFLDFLVSDANTDPDLLHSFVVCFPFYASVGAVLELLLQRHVQYISEIQQAGAPAPARVRAHKRTCSVVAQLLAASWDDLSEAQTQELRVLVFDLVRIGYLHMAQEVRLAMVHCQQLARDEARRVAQRSEARAPLSARQVYTHQTSLLGTSSMELARQLTLADSELYCAIRPQELLAWCKTQDRTVSPHIFQMIHRFNAMSSWCATVVVTELQLRDRVRVLQKLIAVMRCLKKLRNFNSLMAFLAGVSMAAVNRLSHTFDGLSAKSRATLDKARQLMSHVKSYSTYRTALATCSLPVTPYLGLFLTDVTFVHHGNPDTVTAPSNPDLKLINFAKYLRLGSVIKTMQRYQEQSFSVDRNEAIVDLFGDFEHKTEEELFALSQHIEPRNAGLESIA